MRKGSLHGEKVDGCRKYLQVGSNHSGVCGGGYRKTQMVEYIADQDRRLIHCDLLVSIGRVSLEGSLEDGNEPFEIGVLRSSSRRRSCLLKPWFVSASSNRGETRYLTVL